MGDDLITITTSLNSKVFVAGGAFAELSSRMQRGKREMQGILKLSIQEFLEEVVAAVVARNSRPYPGGTSGNSLSRRSGKGMSSLQRGILVTGKSLNDTKGTLSGLGYMGVQEDGGDLTPRNSAYMTIPLDYAMNRDGTPKKPSLRDWTQKTFILNKPDGKRIVMLKLSRTRIVPLYLLLPRVSIKPRLGVKVEAVQRLSALANRISLRIAASLGEI